MFGNCPMAIAVFLDSLGDLLIALSGSGRSKNVLNAIRVAKDIGMDHHLITDYLRTMDMQQSEEQQLVIGHELMRALRKPL